METKTNRKDNVQTWQRIDGGYANGEARIFDNGSGVGPAKGAGRWAVEINGTWIANVDTLDEAKVLVRERTR